MSLTTLATSFRCRFQPSLIWMKLSNIPFGSPACAFYLHDLACCLSDRVAKLATITNLHDVKFEQAGLDLRPPGHPDHAESLFDSFINYRQLGIKGSIPRSVCPSVPTTRPQIKPLIADVFEVLKDYPSCLLDTHTGALRDRDSEQVAVTSLKTRHPPPNRSYPRSNVCLFSICRTVPPTGKIRAIIA